MTVRFGSRAWAPVLALIACGWLGCGSAPPDHGATFAVEPIAQPPTYMGSVDDGAACDHLYATVGFEPDDPSGAPHPLFLYFVGTDFTRSGGSPSGHFEADPAPQAVTRAMAARGFVALSADYDNSGTAWLAGITGGNQNQLACLFGQPGNLIANACALPQVDCDLGIATWGHSQGGAMADMAADFDLRVRAVWVTGVGSIGSSVSKSRLRVVNGANGFNTDVATLDQMTGLSCPDGSTECLRSDGSGWILVQPQDCALSSADHCWFEQSCSNPDVLEPNWVDPASTKPFALESNADWVAATVGRP